jgi:hypothetical protein
MSENQLMTKVCNEKDKTKEDIVFEKRSQKTLDEFYLLM